MKHICPVCGNDTKKYAEDAFYDYYRCLDKRCGNESMELKENRPIVS